MSDIANKTARVLTGAGHAVEALEAIAGMLVKLQVTDSTIPAKILAGLGALDALVHTVLSGLQGTFTPADVQQALDHFRTTLLSNDQAADEALDKRFPKT